MMDLEKTAIERLKLASELSFSYFHQPLIIMVSGGKDSDVLLELTRRSGIPFEVQHHLTTADAPQTVRHIREQFYNLELAGIPCEITISTYKGIRTSMWDLIVIKGIPPTRKIRYCCTVLKEYGGKNRAISTGVRWAESPKRAANRSEFESFFQSHHAKVLLDEEQTKEALSETVMIQNDNDPRRRFIEHCQLQGKIICNPIVDWKNFDIWDFIHAEHIQTNPLYECGFCRVGCIGCPMAGKQRYFEFRLFPKYENLYRRAFTRMLEVRKQRNPDEVSQLWDTLENLWRWWMEDKNLDGQIRLDGI